MLRFNKNVFMYSYFQYSLAKKNEDLPSAIFSCLVFEPEAGTKLARPAFIINFYISGHWEFC